jgi:DNA-binding CsgD family transcriptional regulator
VERPGFPFRTATRRVGAAVGHGAIITLMDAAVAHLEQGREAFARQAWTDAEQSLTAADRAGRLPAEDAERLATCAYMLGREANYLRLLERAHHTHLGEGRDLRALRCAFWIGVTLARRGELAQAGGWLGRAQRLLDPAGGPCVERGYLLLPVAFEQEAGGEWGAAAATLADAAATGERFGDADLVALARHEQGHVLVLAGAIREGIALLDETMLAVTDGDLSPIVAGIVYCGVILACRTAQDVRRAQEWTEALTDWCARQDDLVAFTGRCLVHRAELMELRGAWPEALDEARRAGERALAGGNRAATAEALYRQGELHRLQGDAAAAEAAFRSASGYGREPQPGLACLRLQQGRADLAGAAIRRVVAATPEPGLRAEILPFAVDILLAVGDIDAAREAAVELGVLAGEDTDGRLGAMAAGARGAVALAAGDAGDALVALRAALRVWQELAAPYEEGRSRVLAGLACRALGDEDSAALEFAAARRAFAALGARPDLARLGRLAGTDDAAAAAGLTVRETEVLRRLAAGATNKAIAAELVLSVRTVDRHVSNIFVKLGVSSRTAAAAYAHEHRIV